MGLTPAMVRALTLAFILALTEISGVEAPNVIDTPLGMMSGFVKREVVRVLSPGTVLEDAFLQSVGGAGGNAVADVRNVRDAMPPADIPIVAYDFGMKYNILRRLRKPDHLGQLLLQRLPVLELGRKPAVPVQVELDLVGELGSAEPLRPEAYQRARAVLRAAMANPGTVRLLGED